VSASFARRLSPASSPVGHRLRVKYAAHEVLEIVGVVADMKQYGLESPNMPEVYVPAAQMPVSFMTIVVRTSGGPASLARAVGAAIQRIDRNQPVSRVAPMTRMLSESLARRRFTALLLSIFGGLAMVLAAVGAGGVMAYTVAQRTREIGIRMALGAQRTQVLRQVMREGLVLTAAGLAIGSGAAWLLARLIQKLLFGVATHDPVAFLVSALLLSVVAASACALPARRASTVDPIRALRYE
jgi:putative ABC transport system permease protein